MVTQRHGIGLAALGLMGMALAGAAQAQLGTAEDFAVLAGTTVTNTGSSVIGGSVGLSPGLAVIGFPPGVILPPGAIHAGDAVAAQAQIDLTNAYVSLMARPTDVDLTGTDLGGKTLIPAVYNFASSAQLTGLLTLNGLGNSASEFVFKIGSSLTTASGSAVLLINGANGNNVYWAVGSSATLGTNSVFAGNIVALSSITMTTGATLVCGRALARNGAVTMDSNTITLCAAPGTGGSASDVAMNDLFGEGVAGSQQTAIEASRMFGSALMRAAMAGWEQTLTGRRSIKDEAGIVSYSSVRAWSSGFGVVASHDGVGGSADLHARTQGFAVGLERRIDSTTAVGVAVGYTTSAFTERATNGTVEGAHFGVYGLRRLGSFYLVGTAEYAIFRNTTDRTVDWVLDEWATGSFKSDQMSARLETGWKRSLGHVAVTPFAGVQVSHLRSDGFVEQSTGLLGLTVGPHVLTSIVSSLGVQFDSRIAFAGDRVLQPFVRVAWVHEFNAERGISAGLTLSPDAVFSPQGAPAASDAAKVTAGLKLDIAQHVGLFAFFDGEFSQHGQSYAGNAGLKITW